MNKEKVQRFLIIPEIILIVFLFAISIFSILSSKNEGIARDPIFGLSFLPVKSNSMKWQNPEEDKVTYKNGNFEEGDLIIGKKVKEVSSLEEGDIITYFYYQGSKKVLNTHRIVEITEDGTIWCQGDNHEMSKVSEKVLNGDIQAIYKGKVKGIGKLFIFFEDRTNYTIFILVPLLLLLLWNIFSFVKILSDTRRKSMIQKAVENGEISDELKELAIQEYLAKQKAMAEGQNSDTTNENKDNSIEEEGKQEPDNSDKE